MDVIATSAKGQGITCVVVRSLGKITNYESNRLSNVQDVTHFDTLRLPQGPSFSFLTTVST